MARTPRRAAPRPSELNAPPVSTIRYQITPSALPRPNINPTKWIAAPPPPRKPAAARSGPEARWMTLRNTQLIHS